LISRWSAEAISTGWTSALKARANAPLTSRSRESYGLDLGLEGARERAVDQSVEGVLEPLQQTHVILQPA